MLSAPNGSAIISPLTSIIHSLESLTANAENLTSSAFGLTDTDLLGTDAHLECSNLSSSSSSSCLHLIIEVSAGSLVTLISSLLTPSGQDFRPVALFAINSIARSILLLGNSLSSIDAPPPLGLGTRRFLLAPTSDSPPPLNDLPPGIPLDSPPPQSSLSQSLDFTDSGFISQIILSTAYLSLTSHVPSNVNIGPVLDPTVLSATSGAISNIMVSVRAANDSVGIARAAYVGRVLVSQLLIDLGSTSSSATFQSTSVEGSSFISSFMDATSLFAIDQAINETTLSSFTPSPPPLPRAFPSPLPSPFPPHPLPSNQMEQVWDNKASSWLQSNIWVVVIAALVVVVVALFAILCVIRCCRSSPRAQYRPQSRHNGNLSRDIEDADPAARGISNQASKDPPLPLSYGGQNQNPDILNSFAFSTREGNSDAFITVVNHQQGHGDQRQTMIPLPPMPSPAPHVLPKSSQPWMNNEIYGQSRESSLIAATCPQAIPPPTFTLSSLPLTEVSATSSIAREGGGRREGGRGAGRQEGGRGQAGGRQGGIKTRLRGTRVY